jgi:hypothetical protein
MESMDRKFTTCDDESRKLDATAQIMENMLTPGKVTSLVASKVKHMYCSGNVTSFVGSKDKHKY